MNSKALSYSNSWKRCQIYRFSLSKIFLLHISLSLFPPSDIPLFSNSFLLLPKSTLESLKGPPTVGLAGLEKLSITWCAYDNPNEPGSSLAHLYELIRLTLTTLVELRIDNMPDGLLGDFDLQILKPSGDTLRLFEYTLQSVDESILDTIPTILPHLTKLSIKWNIFVYSTIQSISWKACSIFFYFPLNDINYFLQDAHI
jgi:hypothetical protein